MSRCRSYKGTRAQGLTDVIDGADSVLILAHDLFNVFNTLKPQDIFMYCNVSLALIGRFDELGSTMHNVTHELHDSLEATLDIISCRSVSSHQVL